MTYLVLPERQGSQPVTPAAAIAKPEHAALGMESLERASTLPAEPSQRVVLDPRDPESNAAPAPANAAPAASTARASVVDTHDRPVAGLVLALIAWDGSRLGAGRTAIDGTVELEVGGSFRRMTLDDERWAAVLEPSVSGVFVVAPRVDLGGVVTDSAGRPLAGARVRIGFERSLRSRFSQVLDHSSLALHETITDETGRFDLEAVPSTDLGKLVAEHPGHLASSVSPRAGTSSSRSRHARPTWACSRVAWSTSAAPRSRTCG